ncbi:hypothetical protein Hanom_Chr09g00785841 [Helianthus anomalus]
MGLSYSRLTQEEVDAFCEEWGIDSSFNPGFAFEILCRALGYDPSLLMFRQFFRLAKNGDRECPSRLRPFPEHLLVLTGVSVLWDKPDQDPVLLRDDQVMSPLDFIKSDDTSNVVLGDADVIQGKDAIARMIECRLDASGKYVNVPNVKGFIKAGSSNPSTRRSSRLLLKGPNQSFASEPVDLSDDIEVSDDQEVEAEGKSKKGKELPLVVGKKSKGEDKVVIPTTKGLMRVSVYIILSIF